MEVLLVLDCAVPEKVHTHPMEFHRKFLGEEGLGSQKLRSNTEISGGGRVQNKNTFSVQCS